MRASVAGRTLPPVRIVGQLQNNRSHWATDHIGEASAVPCSGSRLTAMRPASIIPFVPTPADPDVSALLSVRQAIDILDAEPVVPRIVRLPLGRCRGLRLAQDVVSDRDYPPSTRA